VDGGCRAGTGASCRNCRRGILDDKPAILEALQRGGMIHILVERPLESCLEIATVAPVADRVRTIRPALKGTGKWLIPAIGPWRS
jgi:hypothetical protein